MTFKHFTTHFETMNKFENIDKELSLQINHIKQIADELKFKEIFQFDMGDDLTSLSFESLNFSGIYFFEIQDFQCANNIEAFLSDFKLKWEDYDYKGAFVPNTKQKRLKIHTTPLEWVPLYVGKSKNIATRLKGHFFMPLERKTFGMKLSSRRNLLGYRIRVSTIEINVRNYDLIVPQIEVHFREKFNPIIGR